MAKQYDNRNSGMLYKNDRKETEKQPDYKGSFIDKDNVEYWLSGWIKDGKKGKFISFVVEPKDKSQKPQSSKQEYQSNAPDYEENDVPF